MLFIEIITVFYNNFPKTLSTQQVQFHLLTIITPRNFTGTEISYVFLRPGVKVHLTYIVYYNRICQMP